MIRVGFASTRPMTGAQRQRLDSLLALLAREHGGIEAFVQGVDGDYAAADIARRHTDVEAFSGAYVAETDVLVIAPAYPTETLASKAWAAVRLARELGRAIVIIEPDGSSRKESPQ